MANICIFTNDQVAFIQRLYLRKRLPPREVARQLNEKFSTTFTCRQVTSKIAERGWPALRKAARARAVATIGPAIVAQAEQRAQLATVRDIVAGHAQLGEAITTKAKKFVHDAATPKALSSSASAAKIGISIVRDALGLSHAGSPTPMSITFDFNFSRSPESPFSLEGQERERLRKMKAAESVVETSVEIGAGQTAVGSQPTSD